MIFSSIKDFLDNKKNYNQMSFDIFCKKDANTGDISYVSLYDYKDILLANSVEVELTDDEIMRYEYKPKLLSYDIYGNDEYYYIILFINNITSMKKFDLSKRKIRLIKSSDLSTILSSINIRK